MLREGMFLADRYEILEKIGTGGMADVYKAKCHKLNRYVAIKVLKPEFVEDRNFVSKFRAEAQSAAGLMHANIVNVYDVGEETGIYYIIMELVEGITLKKYIEKKGKLGVREAVSIAIQVAQGIEAAHKHHIVHRDIKPQNIIISKEGKVKVTDFGIARAASSNTINSSVMGSVHYISPEQARGGYSDEKSDIYSFGIMLYEMLTGRVPFEGDNTVTVALQHIQDDMVSPRKYVPEIPVSVEKIILKCTQKKTDRRYQNATELIADLKRSLVTPDEDFVVISSAIVPGGATQMIGDDDLAEISQRASQKTAASDGLNVIAPERKEEEYGNAQDRTAEEPEEDDLADGLDEEDDDRDTAASKKIDKIITILGIAVGVVILVIAIIVIIKMVKLFSGDSSSAPKPVMTTEAEKDNLTQVPNVLGDTYEAAKEKLKNAKLGINSREEYSDSYPEGQIFRQSVEAGQKVEPNTTIIVYISKGMESFEMPNVVGSTHASADTTLRNKQLKPTYTFEETEDESKVGLVAATDPVAGTNVKSGDTVTVTIYRGVTQQVAKVPDVKNWTLEDAVAELNALGFVNIERNYEYDEEIAEGKIISQGGPTVGEQAPIESAIVLVISKGQEPTETESTTPEPATPETTTPELTTPETTTPETTTPEVSEETYNAFEGTIAMSSVLGALGGAIDESYGGVIEVKIKVNDSEETSKPVSTVKFNGYNELIGHGDFLLADVDKNITGLKEGSGTAFAEIKYDLDGDGNVDGGTYVKTDNVQATISVQ